MTPVELIGWAAAVVGTLLGVPQVYRLARTRTVAAAASNDGNQPAPQAATSAAPAAPA